MNFIIKINDCRESRFDVVAQRLLKMDVKILSVYIASGFMASLVGILCCEGDVNVSDLEDLKSELYNYIPAYRLANLEKFKGNPVKYQKEKELISDAIHISILTGDKK